MLCYRQCKCMQSHPTQAAHTLLNEFPNKNYLCLFWLKPQMVDLHISSPSLTSDTISESSLPLPRMERVEAHDIISIHKDIAAQIPTQPHPLGSKMTNRIGDKMEPYSTNRKWQR